MVRNSGNLTHHEELRLDYLEKNVYYLNAREKRELAYLQAKDEGLVVSPTPSRATRRRRNEPVTEYRSEQHLDLGPGIEDDDEVYLPKYPRPERRQRPKKVKQHSMVEESPLPQYPNKKEKIRKPRRKGRVKRLLMTLLFLLIAVLAGMAFMFYKGYSSATDEPIVAEEFNGQDTRDGVNILVLGTDGRSGDTSDMTRTDSIMVVNINNKDKKVKMVSFMRDTLVTIDGYDYKINSTYTLGEQFDHHGAENVREILKENLDLDIKHYALVDFSTFATAIDTLFPDGVKMNAQFSTIGGETVDSVEVPNDVGFGDQSTLYQTIHVGEQRMNGQTLLNYARFRSDDEGDYGRTRRQQEVMAAILSQAKDPTKLFTGSEAAGKVFALTSTSLPIGFLVTNGLPVVFDGMKGIEQTTVPEIGDWVDEYDIYGGSGLKIDFEKYKNKLADLGFR